MIPHRLASAYFSAVTLVLLPVCLASAGLGHRFPRLHVVSGLQAFISFPAPEPGSTTPPCCACHHFPCQAAFELLVHMFVSAVRLRIPQGQGTYLISRSLPTVFLGHYVKLEILFTKGTKR